MKLGKSARQNLIGKTCSGFTVEGRKATSQQLCLLFARAQQLTHSHPSQETSDPCQTPVLQHCWLQVPSLIKSSPVTNLSSYASQLCACVQRRKLTPVVHVSQPFNKASLLTTPSLIDQAILSASDTSPDYCCTLFNIAQRCVRIQDAVKCSHTLQLHRSASCNC